MEQFHLSEKKITNGLKIVSYALNSKGEYEQTKNNVWQPVTIVNQQAWQEIEKNITVAKKNITAGRASCLHYYMVANQMDTKLLAQYTGQPRWKVCLHLVPFIFKRLSVTTLKKYSKLYNISPEDLINGKLQPPLYNYP